MFTAMPSERWQVQTAGTVSYSPFYEVMLGAPPAALPGGPPSGPNPDYAASRQEAMTYGAYLGGRRMFSPASSMNMSYEMRYTQFLGAAQYADQRAEFRYTKAVSKGFALNLGYRQSVVTPVSGSTEPAIYGSNVDVGLGYNRALGSSRTIGRLQHRHVDRVDRSGVAVHGHRIGAADAAGVATVDRATVLRPWRPGARRHVPAVLSDTITGSVSG